MLDGALPARDYHTVVKPAIDELLGKEITFDILFHNSEHQATLLRYGVKKSEQVSVERALLYDKYHTRIIGVRRAESDMLVEMCVGVCSLHMSVLM